MASINNCIEIDVTATSFPPESGRKTRHISGAGGQLGLLLLACCFFFFVSLLIKRWQELHLLFFLLHHYNPVEEKEPGDLLTYPHTWRMLYTATKLT